MPDKAGHLYRTAALQCSWRMNVWLMVFETAVVVRRKYYLLIFKTVLSENKGVFFSKATNN